MTAAATRYIILFIRVIGGDDNVLPANAATKRCDSAVVQEAILPPTTTVLGNGGVTATIVDEGKAAAAVPS